MAITPSEKYSSPSSQSCLGFDLAAPRWHGTWGKTAQTISVAAGLAPRRRSLPAIAWPCVMLASPAKNFPRSVRRIGAQGSWRCGLTRSSSVRMIASEIFYGTSRTRTSPAPDSNYARRKIIWSDGHHRDGMHNRYGHRFGKDQRVQRQATAPAIY
jgi:hypothetical protein